MSTDESDRHRVRASDAEREGFATIVRAAMTEGRLTLEEGEERIGKVYAAAYRDELPPITDDLPDGGRRAVYDTPEVHEQVRRQARRFFAGRLGAVAAGTALFVTLGALTHGHFFWPIVPIVLGVIILNRRMMMHRWAAAHWVARSGGPWSGGPWSGGPWSGGPGSGGPGSGGPGSGGRRWSGPWWGGPGAGEPGPGGPAASDAAPRAGRTADPEGWGR